jgi:hypothetical protein
MGFAHVAVGNRTGLSSLSQYAPRRLLRPKAPPAHFVLLRRFSDFMNAIAIRRRTGPGSTARHAFRFTPRRALRPRRRKGWR